MMRGRLGKAILTAALGIFLGGGVFWNRHPYL